MDDRPTSLLARDDARTRAHEIDARVGRRLRLARTVAGLSQEAVGAALGVTFQQIQKYERGANRIAAGTLQLLADRLERDVAWFFGDAPDAAAIDAEEADWVLVCAGLFVTADGLTPYIDKARRLTRTRAFAEARAEPAHNARPAAHFADDGWKSRDALLAMLGSARRSAVTEGSAAS